MTPYTIISRPQNIIRNYIYDVSKKNRNLKYHFSKFLIKLSVPEGQLFYSTLTGLLLLVRDIEKSRDFLIKENILVNDDINEKKIVDKIRAICHSNAAESSTCNKYWIIVTTNCNANCFYCFEKGYKKMDMNTTIAKDIALYIKKQYKGESISLYFTGGEPLLQKNCIDIICNILNESNILYESTLISNGYLFNPNLQKKAITTWNLNRLIVTIDGPEQLYNNVKWSLNKNINQFNIVLSNISNFLKYQKDIYIRVNVGDFNKSEIEEFNTFLFNKFKNYSNITTYYTPLITIDKHIFSQEKFKDLHQLIHSLRIPWKKRKNFHSYQLPGFITGLTPELVGRHRVIKPNGIFAANPDLFNDDDFGSIYTHFKINSARLNFYLEEIEKNVPICDSCPLYPTCFRQKNIISSHICSIFEQTICINKNKENMNFLYSLVKKYI